jgi:hypothetical protein
MLNGKKSIPWYLSAWVLLIALVALWPVGLLLIIGRVKTDRSFHGAAARFLQIAGWILTVTCGLVFLIGLIGLSSESDKSVAIAGIAICLLLTVGGIVLITKGSKLRRVVARRHQLTSLIVNEGCMSVDSMASQIGCGIEEAVQSVRLMMAEGFLPGFALDPDTRFVAQTAPMAANPDRAAFVSFTCCGCGARNQVAPSGEPAVCDYCDLPASVSVK